MHFPYPRLFQLITWLLPVLALLLTACIPYVNQTSYEAATVFPSRAAHADPTRPVVVFSLHKEFARTTLPLVQVLGEKGDFALSISLRGEGARPYRALAVKRIHLLSHGKTLFTTTDSAFVQEVVRAATDTLPTPAYSRYYVSAYVIAVADTSTNLLLHVEYNLLTDANTRVSEQFSGVMRRDRQKGFTGY